MGRFDIRALRYLSKEEMRVLNAVEMGMRNHEMVPVPLIVAIAGLKRGGTKKMLPELLRLGVIAHETQPYDGYRLTNLGYDFLALKSLSIKTSVSAVGSKIGVGKESDIYIMTGPDEVPYAMKLHRLGRTCFRSIKNNRDYLKGRNRGNWLYMARLAAEKEYTFLKMLHKNGFPVPTPIDHNRHIVVMELIEGYPLTQVRLEALQTDPAVLYEKLMNLILRFANQGLIHGDFNEFNIMLKADDTPIILDFPQMISTNHQNAKFYFDRDVKCIRDVFRRKYNFESEVWPDFDEDVERQGNLDVGVEASGFSKEKMEDLEEAMTLVRDLSAEEQEEFGEEDGDDNDDDQLADGVAVNTASGVASDVNTASTSAMSLLVDIVRHDKNLKSSVTSDRTLDEYVASNYWQSNPLAPSGSIENLVMGDYEQATDDDEQAINFDTGTKSHVDIDEAVALAGGVVEQTDYLAEQHANTNRENRPYRIGEKAKEEKRQRYLEEQASKTKNKESTSKGPMDIADVRARVSKQTGSRTKRHETGRAVHLHRNSSKNKDKRTNDQVIKESSRGADNIF